MSFTLSVEGVVAALTGVAFLLAASSERISLCTTLDSKLAPVGYSLEMWERGDERKAHTNTLTYKHAHMNTHTHTLSLTHRHKPTLIHTQMHTHSFSHTHTLSLSHTHTHSLSNTHTCTNRSTAEVNKTTYSDSFCFASVCMSINMNRYYHKPKTAITDWS